MTIQIGDRIPNASFARATAEGPKPVNTADIFAGQWRKNPDLVVKSATRVDLAHRGKPRSNRAVRDGELEVLDDLSRVEIHPLALTVLVPAEATYLEQEVEVGSKPQVEAAAR